MIPQVYLNYDPYTKRQGGTALARQRMDFLLLLLNRARVVIECDGVQHYADDLGRASPQRYAEMVAEDRSLRLRGYEVYRFGGQELREDPGPSTCCAPSSTRWPHATAEELESGVAGTARGGDATESRPGVAARSRRRQAPGPAWPRYPISTPPVGSLRDPGGTTGAR
ncbi:hypothetical protein ACFHW0_18060 [Micromonospora sp. LOL_025]|uniref:hypothetical protein n=1 Tax=Micromonospora sp. LOL_025 TaxID=3345413 RepID=UPI003A83A1CA